ncbi:MAG: hypothetical protein JXR03_05420 [Cyclobacteriaceae bacterium]
MKYFYLIVCILVTIPTFAQKSPIMSYNIDVTQSLDTFYVSLTVDAKVKKSSGIYQFAATAP